MRIRLSIAVRPQFLFIGFALLSSVARLSGAATQLAGQPGLGSASQILPTLFIIGDSTVHDREQGQEGWGDAIKLLLDRTRINVVNRAIGSSSSRTFRTGGYWNEVLTAAKPGDFLLIQFGHNDSGSLDKTGATGSVPGIGEAFKTITKSDGSTETIRTFGWYLEQYIVEARSAGITPIVCSYIPRCPRPSDGKAATMPSLPVTPMSYALWAKESAEKRHVDFIDLNGIIWGHYSLFTPAQLKAKFFTDVDYTHTSPAGAELNAQAVIEGLRDLKECALNQYVLPGALQHSN